MNVGYCLFKPQSKQSYSDREKCTVQVWDNSLHGISKTFALSVVILNRRDNRVTQSEKNVWRKQGIIGCSSYPTTLSQLNLCYLCRLRG